MKNLFLTAILLIGLAVNAEPITTNLSTNVDRFNI